MVTSPLCGLQGSGDHFDRSVVVAVVAVRVVETAIDDVVDVVAMGDCFVAAAGSVDVAGLVSVGGVRATVGIGLSDGDGVLFHDTVFALVMEVSVMDIVNVVAVADGSVAAARAVLVVVILVALGFAHDG